VLFNDRAPRVVPATRCTARAGGAAAFRLAATPSRSRAQPYCTPSTGSPSRAHRPQPQPAPSCFARRSSLC